MENERRVVVWHPYVLTITGGISMALGLMVMAGWYIHSAALIQVFPLFVPMQYNTALGFVLCGLGMLGAVLGYPRLAALVGAVAGVMGTLTLAEYIFALNLGIDQFLMTHYVLVETSHPGRMAPNTALCFMLVAAALLVMGLVAPFKGRPLLVGSLSALILTLSGVAFSGYLTGASTAYGWGTLTNMAMHTAAGFMVLGIGILVAAYQEGVQGKSEPVDVFTLARWRVFLVAALLMTAVTLSVALNVLRELNHVVVEQKQEDLLTLIVTWAESMNIEGNREAETLQRASLAFERLHRLDGTSEMVLARRQGDQMLFFLSSRGDLRSERALVVPVDSGLAEPMRRALLGQSGTIIEIDYEGRSVLAAYTPFGMHGWGLVGKVNMEEVRGPLVRASLLTAAICLVIVVLSALFIVVVFDPMIRRLAMRTAALAREVHEHERAEKALRKSEMRFRHLFEQAPVSLWEEDFSEVHRWVQDLYAQGVDDLGDYLDRNPEAVQEAVRLVRIVAVNQASLELFGSSSMEEMVESLAVHFTENSAAVFKSELVALDGSATRFQSIVEVKTVPGKIRNVMLNLFVDTSTPSWRHVYVSMLDITEARKTEEKLREHREQLESLVGERTSQLKVRVTEVEQLNAALLNLADDLRTANAELNTSTLRLAEGNRELKSFTYSVSHDLRAPLRAISGFAEIITRRHRSDLNEEGQKYLGHIVTAAGNMGRLIDDLLRFARLGRGALKLRPVPLQGLLSRVIADLAGHQAAVDGAVEAPDDLPVVLSDETLLGQIFTNLLDNALTYHRPGFPPEVVIKWREDSGSVVLSVSDRGIGIPAKDQDKIFNIFQRLHSSHTYSGNGVGLAIVKKAVALLNGQVWVESSEGEGSAFHVRIPRAAVDQERCP